ncbi:hypothetical protein ALP11_05659 [Pseudomonas syringae pv. papulans]|nr:hypothetical protein ALP11_05659 [Pseudomonas syringae pv. papulans]
MHDPLAILSALVGLIRSSRSIGGMSGNVLSGGRHLGHGGRDLIGTLELLMSALRHQLGNGIQLAARRVQIGAAALEAVEGVSQEIPQGICGNGQTTQFVLSRDLDTRPEFAFAQLGDVFDKHANGRNQVAIDHPQRQQTDQQRRHQHHHGTDQNGTLGFMADGNGLSIAALVQLFDQTSHLLAGRTVDTFDRDVTRASVTARSNKRITTGPVGRTQRLVCLLQRLHLAFQHRVGAVHFSKPTQRALHLALLLFELPPVLVALGGCFATQQDVFPLLDLNLELQVGFVHQLRRPDRAVDKAAISLHVIGEKVEAGQGNDQHKRKATAEQT